MSSEKKSIRERFRNGVFERDGHKCKACGRSDKDVKLDAHHITDRNLLPNGGYVKENGISLCDEKQDDGSQSCHMKAEHYHITSGKEHIPGFHPDELYRMIGSSLEKAIKASERL